MGAIDFGTRVWQGDPSTVREARMAYECDTSDENLLRFATALYSFRREKCLADELISLKEELIDLAYRTGPIPGDAAKCKEVAVRADVLSTHLEWMSRQINHPMLFSQYLRDEAWGAAEGAVKCGIECASKFPTDHTLPLLHLTSAQLYSSLEEHRHTRKALQHLHIANAVVQCASIMDPRQRVRIYAKLGLLYRQCGETSTGIMWGIRALLVSGVPANVRVKALAALLGINK